RAGRRGLQRAGVGLPDGAGDGRGVLDDRLGRHPSSRLHGGVGRAARRIHGLPARGGGEPGARGGRRHQRDGGAAGAAFRTGLRAQAAAGHGRPSDRRQNRYLGELPISIASGGIHRPGYMVESVEQPDGSMVYQHEAEESRVLEEDVAINATVALQGPPSAQGSARKLQQVMGGRPIAGKTGTSESFRSAWFVGFTPQLVTSVGMFQPSEDGTSEERLTPFG